MPRVSPSGRKPAFNITLSESLVEQVRVHTSNLSATVEDLLGNFLCEQQQVRQERQRMADACADDWNALNESVGLFADEHSTL